MSNLTIKDSPPQKDESDYLIWGKTKFKKNREGSCATWEVGGAKIEMELISGDHKFETFDGRGLPSQMTLDINKGPLWVGVGVQDRRDKEIFININSGNGDRTGRIEIEAKEELITDIEVFETQEISAFREIFQRETVDEADETMIERKTTNKGDFSQLVSIKAGANLSKIVTQLGLPTTYEIIIDDDGRRIEVDGEIADYSEL